MDAHEFAKAIHDSLETEGTCMGLDDPEAIDDLELNDDGTVTFRVSYGGAELFDVTVKQI